MGFAPQQIRQMSMFQYLAAVDGYIEAHSSEEDNSLTNKEADELWDWIDGG